MIEISTNVEGPLVLQLTKGLRFVKYSKRVFYGFLILIFYDKKALDFSAMIITPSSQINPEKPFWDPSPYQGVFWSFG